MKDLMIAVSGWCMIGLLLASFIPFSRRRGHLHWSFLFPVVALLIYIPYEALMPVDMDIRVDLLILIPLAPCAVLAVAIRLIKALRERKSERE